LGICVVASLSYTWERLTVESMLEDNFVLERDLELIQKRTERLCYEVTGLQSLSRIRHAATTRLGMAPMDWNDVLVIGEIGVESR
jgi:hypothetical protein